MDVANQISLISRILCKRIGKISPVGPLMVRSQISLRADPSVFISKILAPFCFARDGNAAAGYTTAEVPNRRFSGEIEVSVKRFVSDVTNWRKMLSGEPEPIDLKKMKTQLSNYVPEELKKYIVDDDTVTNIKYPILSYPKKIKNAKLEKNPKIQGELLGIKGQYLILDQDRVLYDDIQASISFLREIDVDVELF